jgi:GR25 family glycosyltransferase involved in LPS biosynthesis
MNENIDDTIFKNFILSPSETNVVNLLRYLRTNNFFQITILLSEYFETMFPFSTDIKDECAISSYYSNDHSKAYDVHERCLNMRGLNQNIAWRMLFNQHFSINNVADRYIFYNKDIVNYITNKPIKDFPLVTLTITTCKRFDLFEKTMNSLLNCVDIDNIDFWFCVDDNSSNEDRDKMKSLYPFFNFYFKDIKEKGHPQSMNIIKNFVKTPYIFHLEDDWKFFVRRNYIQDAIEVIESNKTIAQCLFNKNYSEIESDIDIKGGIYKLTNSGFRYFIHEYCKNDEEIRKWTSKYGNCKSSSYWPYWSLRPSVFKTSIFNELGDFDEKVSHFEMNYAHRYASKGYVSAFFEGIYCLHTGRLTSERDDETKLNAYKLNNEAQFYGKEKLFSDNKNFKTFVVNLDRRRDRWESFIKNADSSIKFLNYERFSAVDGKDIKNSCQLQQIFENNDYNMRRGMVGCLLSHVKLYTDLINSNYDYFIILEDDIEFTPNFEDKYNNVFSQLSDKSWDFLFLGHHVKDKNKQNDELNKDKTPIITKRNAYWSFLNSLGGTGGYIITKQGATKLLDFINKTGSTNGIDTLIQKSANELDVYYTNPHLIFTDCYRGDNNLDTDIQFDYSNDLVLSLEQRLQNELKFFDNKINLISDLDKAKELSSNKSNKDSFYFVSTNNIEDIMECCVHHYYTLENKIIFVIPDTTNVNRYFHRFKKFDKYDISDVIIY